MFRAVLVAALFVAVNSQIRGDELADHPFFRSLTGTWSGDGQLVNADGDATPIHEEWEGKRQADGTFTMAGTRQWGEEDQEFRWVFHYNPTTELYECEYWHSGMDEKLRFEVQLADARVELRAPMGDPGSELLISNEIDEEEIDGQIRLTAASGETNLEGSVRHKRRGQGE